MDRRTALQWIGASSAGLWTRTLPAFDPGVWVNDVHSALNPTHVSSIVRPSSRSALQRLIGEHGRKRLPLAISGARHAMGGQAFRSEATLLDMRGLARVLGHDADRRTLEVEAGISWPMLCDILKRRFPGEGGWTFRQKQTGTDELTLGGCLAANAHGRGLKFPPFVDDVESFTLVAPDGALVRCSRQLHPDLFRQVIGGYGAWGPVYSIALRLVPRTRLVRRVEILTADRLMDGFARRAAEGCVYGDFQFAVDPGSEGFLNEGVFSCYAPAQGELPANRHALANGEWETLLGLAHTDPSEAFRRYSAFYLSTDGQQYLSDDQQMGYYPAGYHARLNQGRAPGAEMITELYVPRARHAAFLADAATALRANGTRLIYGTVRLIEPDRETALAWAREPFACTIFNLHVPEDPDGRCRAVEAFRTLLDLALARGGNYYLTYHRWARRDQVLAAYPQFPAFLDERDRHDPHGIFQSDWLQHHRLLLAGS